METESRKKQHYAVSKEGALLHITEAHKIAEDVYCPHCGCRMLRKCGNKRTWHFAHDFRDVAESGRNCSYESYLHAFAKLRFKQWFDESSEIRLHYQKKYICKLHRECKWLKHDNSGCYRIGEDNVFNLKSILTKCNIEETIQVNGKTFKADLLLSNPEKPSVNILIEIKVTHECSQKKKNSNIRIIEFEIHSEEDVNNIIGHDIIESEFVRFYGFKLKQIDTSDSIPPKYKLSKFIQYNNGSSYSGSECSCQDYYRRRKSAQLEITALRGKDDSILDERANYSSGIPFGQFYNWGLALANYLHCNAKNCYLCVHHKYDYDECCLFCSLNEKPLETPKQAQDCPSYNLDKKFCNQNLLDLKEYSTNNIIDIWHSDKGIISLDNISINNNS